MAIVDIKQLTDDKGKLIAPFTPEHAIYDTNGKRLDLKLAGLDTDRISSALTKSEQAISAQTTDSIQLIRTEGASYDARLDKLEAFSANTDVRLGRLEGKIFPLTITTTITPNADVTRNTISYNVTEIDGVTVVLSAGRLDKTYKNTTTNLYTGTATATTVTSDIQGAKEVFKISVTTRENKTTTREYTRYLMTAGSTNTATLTYNQAVALTRYLASGISFTPTVTTTDNSYIWLVVPSDLTIHNAVSQGFNVTLNNPITISGTLGSFKAYRSANMLTAAQWNLTVS
jgi:hypothetical protein